MKSNVLTLWTCLTHPVWSLSQFTTTNLMWTLCSGVWYFNSEITFWKQSCIPLHCPDQLNWSQFTLCYYYQRMFQVFGWPCGSWERERCILKPAGATDLLSCRWCPWSLLHFIKCLHYSRSYACRPLYGRYWTSAPFPTWCIINPLKLPLPTHWHCT